MPPAVPIPSNSSTSRLEHMLASFDEASRQRFGGRRESGHGPTLPGITTASTTPPVHSFAQSVSNSFRPRVIRGPTTSAEGQAASVGTRPSISPTRLRASSHLSNRPHASVSVLPNAVRAGLPTFTPPAYLANALMAGLFHGGPPPPQAIVPNSRVAPDPQQIISDSEDSSHGHSGLSSRRRYRMQIPRNFTSWPTTLPIPTQWSETDKHNHLIVSSNGKEVSFSAHSGTSETGSAAAIRAECSIPAACGVYYYEVKIVDRGYRGQISVGFATKELQVSKLPGWEAGSWGYHGDDGLAFGGQPRPGSEFGPHFSTDDVIGCGINFLEHNAFFTKNGTLIGSVFSDIPDRDVYPAIGLRSANEHIRANFGDSPFLFDIDAYVSRLKLKAWKDVQSHTTVLSRSQSHAPHYEVSSVDVSKREYSDDGLARAAREQQEGLRGVMADLIMDYLVFQGYAKTAHEFRSQLLDRVSKKPERPAKIEPVMDVDEVPISVAVRLRLESMEHRARATNAVRNGDIDLALSIMQSHFPASLTHDEGLLRFKLQCQQFVELSLEAQEVKRRSDKEHEQAENDAAKSGSVPTDGTFAMDLDDDEHVVPSSPASRGYVVWANGNSGSAAKGKGRPNARRRSSASRTGGRSQSRNRGESGSLLSPISPSAMEEDKMQVIRYVERVVEYGMQFRKEWESDTRPFIKDQLRRTFGLVAYDDPRTDQRSRDLVSEEARLQLADEVNRIILLSTANEPMPLIERMYRHSNTTMQALGAIEVGAGAFMDVSRILEDFV